MNKEAVSQEMTRCRTAERVVKMHRLKVANSLIHFMEQRHGDLDGYISRTILSKNYDKPKTTRERGIILNIWVAF